MDHDLDDENPIDWIPYECRLCRFRIAHDDPIVVVTETGHTRQFRYNDTTKNPGYVSTNLRPRTYENVAAGCHWSCFLFAPSPPSLPLLKATDYSFEPCERVRRERETSLLNKLSRRLSSEYGTLPPEIWLMVARYLVRECAVVTLQESWLGRHSFSRNLDISKGISVRHVRIEGVRYVAHLSNTHNDGEACILTDRIAPTVNTLYVLEDHLGIRQILFDTPSKSIDRSKYSPEPGVWWRTIPVTDRTLQTVSDGLKLRKITSSSLYQRARLTAWPTPMAQSDIRLLHFHDVLPLQDFGLRDARMTSLRVNEPAITGYSACWVGHIVGLHAHSKKEEDLSFYRDYSTCQLYMVWMYICMNPGEFITELWSRKTGYFGRYGAIMFKTNTGREIIIGPYLQPGFPPVVWTQLCTLSNSPSQVYFDDHNRGIAHLATSSTSLPTDNQQPPSQTDTLSPYPKPSARLHEDFFYSTADLTNAVKITLCQERSASNSPIIGLLIQYSNGNRACVGQVRLDYLGTEFSIERFPTLCLWFARTESNRVYVAKVDGFPPSDSERYQGLEIRWEGRLEWWFSYDQCQVYYDGKLSPSLVRDR